MSDGTSNGTNALLSKIIKWGQVAGILGGMLLGGAHFYYAFQTCKVQAEQADFKADRIERYLSSQNPAYWQMTGQLGQVRDMSNPVSR